MECYAVTSIAVYIAVLLCYANSVRVGMVNVPEKPFPARAREEFTSSHLVNKNLVGKNSYVTAKQRNPYRNFFITRHLPDERGYVLV
jgi:hypothetical protein